MHESNENGHVTLFGRFGGAAERRKRNAQKQLSLVGLLAAVGVGGRVLCFPCILGSSTSLPARVS